MRYNELELKKLMKKGFDNLLLDERIAIDILNFINTVYLNKQDFCCRELMWNPTGHDTEKRGLLSFYRIVQ